MTTRGRPLALLTTVLLAAGGRGALGLTIVQDGQPKATVVTAAEASDKVRAAAEELRHYVTRMSGAELPMATDAEETRGAVILVGPSRLTAAMDIPSGLTAARREEGFAIRCRGDRLVLAGNDAGPYHGTEYAVYELLRRLGVRWFMPGEFGEVVPARATIEVAEVEVTERPDFVMRNWWLHAQPELLEQERLWKLRNKMNPEIPFAIPGDSSARNVLPEGLYFKDHPDYFAMNPDGTRNPYLPNLSSKEAVRIAAQTIKEYLRQHPEANSYGFAPDDGYPRDYTPETMARNQGFVTLGGRPGVPGEASTTEEWITFVNDVTREVREEFPDVYIATNGYANRNDPPQGVVLDDHLVIMFAAIWSCTLHAYDDPHCWQKVRQGELLRRWCELCDNVWIYGYNYQMLVSGLTPLPETRKLRRDFPLMHRWGVMGFHDETRNVWAECGIASRYLRAQLEWDAEADADAILRDFYAQWYGPAAEAMQAYNEALEAAIESSPMHGHEDRVLPEVYTPELLRTLEEHLKAAERAAEGTDSAKLHVRADRLIFDHLRAYVAMSRAEAEGDFAEAARQAQRMLDLRAELHAISAFFIWPDEQGYHTGIWYWGVTARRDHYRSLDDLTTGRTGKLIARLPQEASFRTDPHDDGLYAGWFAPDWKTDDWTAISTARPFYCQGYEDEQGHPFTGHVWYRLRVDVPQEAEGKAVHLYLPTVTTEAWCWVNGQYVGHRPYLEAYIRPAPMEVEVGPALQAGKRNEIVVRVSTSLCPEQGAEGIMGRGFLYEPGHDGRAIGRRQPPEGAGRGGPELQTDNGRDASLRSA